MIAPTKEARLNKIVRIYSIVMLMSSEVSIDDFIRANPCRIWDVFNRLDWYEKDIISFWLSDNEMEILILWNMWKNKPIEDQEEKCIDFIYNLIQDDTNG